LHPNFLGNGFFRPVKKLASVNRYAMGFDPKPQQPRKPTQKMVI
jgi:hypothetical protein